MKLLLIHPPDLSMQLRFPPLGLCYIGAIAESKGWQVAAMNVKSSNPSKLDYKFLKEVHSFAPDVIGINIHTFSALTSYNILKGLLSCGATMVAGGPHATILPEEVLTRSPCDIVVRAEGEKTFCELLEFFEERNVSLDRIKGISFKNSSGEIIHTPERPLLSERDLNQIPLPAKHIFSSKNLRPYNLGNIITSRGCPFSCIFCSQSVFKNAFRQRSVESVFFEIESLYVKYGVRHLFFVDDVLTLNEEWVLSLCKKIIHSKIPLTWHCFSRIDCVSRNLLGEMKKAGCISIIYGVESINANCLNKIGKKVSAKDIYSVLSMTHEIGIPPFISLIWGFPWETSADINDLVRFVEKIFPLAYLIDINKIVPFPGTKLYNKYSDSFGFDNWWIKMNDSGNRIPFYKHMRGCYPGTENRFFHSNRKNVLLMEKAYAIADNRRILSAEIMKVVNGKYKFLNQEKVIKSLSYNIIYFCKKTVIKSSQLFSYYLPEVELRLLMPVFKFIRAIFMECKNPMMRGDK